MHVINKNNACNQQESYMLQHLASLLIQEERSKALIIFSVLNQAFFKRSLLRDF